MSRLLTSAALAFLALPLLAGTAVAKGPASDLDNVKMAKAMAGMAAISAPPPLNYDGGTAIINFVAPVNQQTMAELAQTAQNAVIGGADAIRINISSQGGMTSATQFAVNVLKNLSVPVETVAMSQIASAAVALYCAGDTRHMADGSTLYLHQQWSIREIQEKTAAAVVRGYRLSSRWYEDLIHACTDDDADRAMLDYSSRDVVIDKKQARELGMITGPMKALHKAKTWGAARNVVAQDIPFAFGSPTPYR